MPIHGYPGGVITANPVAPTSTVATGVWTTEQQLQAVSQGNWPFTIPTQQISRSLRFNSADSAYLNRTFGTPTNQIKWTISLWLKRGEISVEHMIYGSYPGSGESFFTLFYPSTLNTYISTSITASVTNAVFRDGSGWYHLVQVFDSANATAADRFITYMNGVRQTTSSLSVTQNDTVGWNSSGKTGLLGRGADGGGWFGDKRDYFDGYLTEINFVDGQALTPSSFGQTNASTGVWEPINYTGTYGNNGFYLNFSDNSGTTSTTLGKDSSGNGNNWTPNNFSVTAGVGNDSLVDSPTSYGTDTGVGGEVRGNYCTLNPVDNTGITISNGNLIATTPGSNQACKATMSLPTTGKWYFECTDVVTGGNNVAGIANVTLPTNTSLYLGTGSIWVGMADNAVFGFAFNFDSLTYTIYKNNSVNSSGSITSGITYILFIQTSASGGASTAVNFGQRPFAYTAPSGFKALCTQNLPTPTIGATSTTQANDYFNAVTYSGSSAEQNITGVGFQPDFVWIKSRSNAESHVLSDVVRGATGGSYYRLFSDATAAESANVDNSVLALNADGFRVSGGTAATNVGRSGYTYVSWNWKANGAGSSNTAGTITSTVSANTTSGFSIVTYTGTGSNATVGHGLGVAPSMIIVKYRNVLTSNDWNVYHSSVGATGRLFLNLTSGTQTTALAWNNTAPTSTVFSIGTGSDVNYSATNYVAYCFAPVAGYSAFGSYTGNGSTDGPFVYLGFRPEFVMIKRTDSANEWLMHDSARSPYNVVNARLSAQSSAAESTSPDALDFTSNGFKLRTTDTGWNASGGTYIYMAFAESPFKYSLAR